MAPSTQLEPDIIMRTNQLQVTARLPQLETGQNEKGNQDMSLGLKSL